jgi:hypothetical protein
MMPARISRRLRAAAAEFLGQRVDEIEATLKLPKARAPFQWLKGSVLLITELDSGGAQMVLLRLLSYSNRQRFDHRVACLFGGQGSVGRRIRGMGLVVINLGMETRWRLDAFVRLYSLLRRERPDILHTWMFHSNIPGRIVGRLAGTPIIISAEHTMGQEGRTRRTFNRLTAPLAERVICVSRVASTLN